MAHHQGPTEHWNCTSCKEDQGRHGMRLKYGGGVFCPRCYNEIHHRGRGFSGGLHDIWGFFGRTFRWLVDLVTKPLRSKVKKVTYDSVIRTKARVAKERVRAIPINPATMSPQKH